MGDDCGLGRLQISVLPVFDELARVLYVSLGEEYLGTEDGPKLILNNDVAVFLGHKIAHIRVWDRLAKANLSRTGAGTAYAGVLAVDLQLCSTQIKFLLGRRIHDIVLVAILVRGGRDCHLYL